MAILGKNEKPKGEFKITELASSVLFEIPVFFEFTKAVLNDPVRLEVGIENECRYIGGECATELHRMIEEWKEKFK